MSEPISWQLVQLRRERDEAQARCRELGDEVERLAAEVARLGGELREEARLHARTTDLLAEALDAASTHMDERDEARRERDAARRERDALSAALPEPERGRVGRMWGGIPPAERIAELEEDIADLNKGIANTLATLTRARDEHALLIAAHHDTEAALRAQLDDARAESAEMRAALVRLGSAPRDRWSRDYIDAFAACRAIGERLAAQSTAPATPVVVPVAAGQVRLHRLGHHVRVLGPSESAERAWRIEDLHPTHGGSQWDVSDSALVEWPIVTLACPHISTTMPDDTGSAECFTFGARREPRVEDVDPEAW